MHCCVVTLYRTSHRRHSIVSVFLFLLASVEEARAGRAGEERQLDTREGAWRQRTGQCGQCTSVLPIRKSQSNHIFAKNKIKSRLKLAIFEVKIGLVPKSSFQH